MVLKGIVHPNMLCAQFFFCGKQKMIFFVFCLNVILLLFFDHATKVVSNVFDPVVVLQNILLFSAKESHTGLE